MKKTYRNILEGIGSIFDIMPSTDYSRFVPKDTEEDVMRQAWEQAGDDIQKAFEQLSNGLDEPLDGVEYFSDEQRNNETYTKPYPVP